MKALLVKTSSIGDLLHALPAVSDAVRAHPGLRFDWVVEEGLKAVPAWHPAVERVITVAYRKWRFRPLKGLFGGPLAAFRQELRRETYDRVIDAQGLYKSAVITRMALGERHGLDLASCREKLAPLAYQRRHAVPRGQHAVQRLRALFALALDYPLPTTTPDYGIERARLPPPPLPGRYLAFLHGTAWTSKLWPESHWRGLAGLAAAGGYWIALPFQGARDEGRARRIAEGIEAVKPVNTPTLEAAAGLIAGAAGAVAVDTGLGHLAAALGVPSVSLYGPTGAARTGTVGRGQEHLESRLPCAPCRNKICNLTGRPHLPSPCLEGLTDGQVWLRLAAALTRPRPA
jgi:heptosyltransferase-1